LSEHLVGVVTVAMLQFDLQLLVVQLDLDAAEAPVLGSVGAVVTDDVVAVDVLLRLGDAETEVVVVEQRLAAGVRGERDQSLLLIVAAIHAASLMGSAEYAGSARRGDAGVARRGFGNQSGRVYRIKRYIRADRCVHRGSELRLIFDARLGNAAR